jgi:CPA2 family monovalent cation:H+ antiporter-2
MHDAHVFLYTLAVVLCVAAVTTVVFQRLRQPIVLGYLLAGMIVGPHVPIPLVADEPTVQILAELGVILLMFSLGLEFSLRKLARVGVTAVIIAVIQVALMLWLGYLTGAMFGWTGPERLFTGAIIAISSTTIIAKAFEEHRVEGRLREIVFGVLIVEDLVAILLLTTLTTVGGGASLSAKSLLLTGGRLAGFLAAVLVAGLLVVPRLMRLVVKLGRSETTLVASVGLCFAMALVAQGFGYSVALGAFLAGSLIAESGQEKAVEHLVKPVRDMFAAIFFVAVGVLIDPKLVLTYWLPILTLVAVVVLGKLVGVAAGAFITGAGVPLSIRSGMSLAQIGEFSFIIAALGRTLGATGDFLYPVAVAVSAITTLLTPWLIRASTPVAEAIDSSLPRPLQTVATLYGSWIERLRSGEHKDTTGARVRRLVLLQVLDAACISGLICGTSIALPWLTGEVEIRTGMGAVVSRSVVLAAATALSIPFFVGLARLSRALATLIATEALPLQKPGKTDLAYAPRRVLVIGIQLATLCITGLLVLTVVQPFIRPIGGAAAIICLLAALAAGFWKSAKDLEGHVRAGSLALIEALAAGTGSSRAGSASPPSLEPLHALFPGLGDPEPIRISADAPSAGRSLAELNVRGRTGGTILAIRRGEEAIVAPTGHEILRAGDILAVAGAHGAVDAVRALLLEREPEPGQRA